MKREYWRWRGYLLLFLLIHLFNPWFILRPSINHNMNPFALPFFESINAIIGNFSVLLVFIALVMLCSTKKRTVMIWITGTTIFLSIFVFLMKVYVFYYGSFFSWFITQNFSNPNNIMALQLTVTSLKMMFYEAQFVTLLPIVVILLYNVFVLHKDMKSKPDFWENVGFKKKSGVIFLAISFAMYIVVLANGAIIKQQTHSYFQKNMIPLYGIQTTGIYHYYIAELGAYLTRSPLEYSPEDEAQLDTFYQTKIQNPCYQPDCEYQDTDSPFHGLFEGKNLIIIQIESFNTFYLNLVMNDLEVLPFLNSLTRRDDVLFYPNFYSSIGIGKTTDAEFASLTGIYPTGFTVTYFEHVVAGIETLPKLFNQKDYHTITFNGSPNIFYSRHIAHPILGFQESYGTEQIDPSGIHQLNGWTKDDAVFDYAHERLNTTTKPFFTYLLTTSSHLPYYPVDGVTGGTDWGVPSGTMVSNSFDYFHLLDRDLGAFFEAIEEEPWFNDTVFLFHGDHSSGLTHQDLSYAIPNVSKPEFQRMLHSVPMLIYTPGLELNGVDTSLVRSQVDIKRTVANLFSLDIQDYFGVDILSNQPTVAYNPQTFDIATDFGYISATQRSMSPTNGLSPSQMQEYIQAFFDYKVLNDLLLKGRYLR